MDFRQAKNLQIWADRDRDANDNDYMALIFWDPDKRGPNALLYMTLEQAQRVSDEIRSKMANDPEARGPSA